MQTMRGAWIITDSGYPNWHCFIAPHLYPWGESERKFSSGLESQRKDIERTFGSLKKRFRVLKGFRMKGQAFFTKVFHVCCAFHNHLLEYNRGDDVESMDEVMEDDNADLGNMEDENGEDLVAENYPRGAVSREGEEMERRAFLRNHYLHFKNNS